MAIKQLGRQLFAGTFFAGLGNKECHFLTPACRRLTLSDVRNYNHGMLLEGVFAAVTTCFYPDGRPYWRKLEHNVDRYSRTPLSGLVLLGSTGEAVMLSEEESREALRVARAATAPDKVLLAGVGRESVFETLRMADYAAALDYDAILVRTPHYYRKQMRNREMLTYYQAVADRSPLPVLLYSVPVCTAYDLPVEVVAELAMHPNIVGMKDSSGNVERIAQLVHATRSVRKRSIPVTTLFSAVTSRMLAPQMQSRKRGRLLWLRTAWFRYDGGGCVAPSASAKNPFPGSGLSAALRVCPNPLPLAGSRSHGWCARAGNFAPQACHEVYTAWKENDAGLAADKQRRIVRAGIEVCGQMGIPGVKYALDLNGYYGGRPRMPLLPLVAEEQRLVEELTFDIRN